MNVNSSSDTHVRPRPLAVGARCMFVAVTAAVPLGVMEVAYVLLVRRPGLDSPGQAALFALQTVALLAGAGAVLGAFQGPLSALVVVAARRLPPWRGDRGLRTAAVAALLSAPALAWLAWQLLSGRRAAQLPLRPLALVLAVLLGATAVFWGIRLLLAVHRRLDDGRWSWYRAVPLSAGLLVLGAALYVADQRALSGLYPALHAALDDYYAKHPDARPNGGTEQ